MKTGSAAGMLAGLMIAGIAVAVVLLAGCGDQQGPPKPKDEGEHQVAQEQWETVMRSNPSRSKGPKNPVGRVSWREIQGFLEQARAE